MNTCNEIDTRITPFVDGELDEPERRSVEEHLRRCAPCHSKEAAERAVRTAIHARKTAFETPGAPDALRTACAEIARQPESARRSETAPLKRRVPAADDGSRGFSRAPWRQRLGPYAL